MHWFGIQLAIKVKRLATMQAHKTPFIIVMILIKGLTTTAAMRADQSWPASLNRANHCQRNGHNHHCWLWQGSTMVTDAGQWAG